MHIDDCAFMSNGTRLIMSILAALCVMGGQHEQYGLAAPGLVHARITLAQVDMTHYESTSDLS